VPDTDLMAIRVGDRVLKLRGRWTARAAMKMIRDDLHVDTGWMYQAGLCVRKKEILTASSKDLYFEYTPSSVDPGNSNFL
jgi:hypothetical protein